ncbi:hypothetical protein [Oceanobacillus sp. FSL H7-0719]|uniref:hypothetical protein n=1 Tax=Oceanobacillus sp. FSL H7-0719 TaxID=2954507 RepID=UPI00325507D7
MTEVILARYRNSDYTVRCEINGSEKKYTWKGSNGKKIDKKKVPQEVVDWLNMNTVCFSKGKLVIEGKKEDVDKQKEEMTDPDLYDKNTHTREEIEKALTGHHKTLEKLLNDVTVDDEKRFVTDIAVELQDKLTGANQTRIAEWAGIEKEILFN